MSQKKTNRTQRRADKNSRRNKQLKRIQDVIQGKEVTGAEPKWLPEVWTVFGAAYTEAIVEREKKKNAMIAPQTEVNIFDNNVEMLTPIDLMK